MLTVANVLQFVVLRHLPEYANGGDVEEDQGDQGEDGGKEEVQSDAVHLEEEILLFWTAVFQC